MYLEHFGLSKPPFKITPDPELFFAGGNRGAVLEALIYAVSSGEGIVKVVGEVGSGKTMLCRMLERELPDHCEIVYLANPALKADEILGAIAFELGIADQESNSKLKVLHAIQDFLLRKHADGRRVIVFVEEAQGMPIETLEEIRLLTNLETTQDKLLQIVLFGQPELDEKLQLHEIRQLKERITHTFELSPFKPEEVREYLNARIRASGYRGTEIFSKQSAGAIAQCSSGLLRRINILADKSLLAAFAAGQRSVRSQDVRLAAKDSGFPVTGSVPLRWSLAFAGLIVVGLGVGYSLAQLNRVADLSAGAQKAPLAPGGASVQAPYAPEAIEAGQTVRLVTPSQKETVAPALNAQTAAEPLLVSRKRLIGIEKLAPNTQFRANLYGE
ncbi:MAG: AAA family ATPase, partial [Pseudomonadota bacterium]